MNKEDAQKEVINIGVAYFQDWISDFENIEQAIASIFQEIKEHASGTRLTGIDFWRTREEAVRTVIQELSADQLDVIMELYYGIRNEEVDDSKLFFQRLYTTIADGIKNAYKPR